MTLTYGSACSGYGGLELGVQSVLGGETLWHVEFDKAPSKILEHHWPGVPNYGDFTKINWYDVPRVHVMTAGYPCQPFSQAGKRLGTDDPRHLWPHIAQAVAILRPPLLVFENVRGHLTLGFDEVVRDLHQLGYDVTWYLLRAADVGAAHGRARLFIFGRNRGKCGVCGRSDRRGGMDRDHEPSHGADVRDQPQGVDVGHGTAGAARAGEGARRKGDTGSRRNGQQATDLALGADREEGRDRVATRGASPEGEAGAGADRAGTRRHDRVGTDGSWRRGEVDPGNDRDSGSAASADQASESARTRSGSADGDAAGGLPLGDVVGTGGRPVRAGGVSRSVPDVRADGRGSCLCDELVGGAHGRFRVFLFATPADAGSLGWGEGSSDGAGPGAASGAGQAGRVGGHRVLGADGEGLTLLPTPAVNDMGAAYTPETWDAWTAKLKADHGNGNGHGKSLAIEAQRLLPTPTTTQRGTNANLDTREGARANLHNEVAKLLPTPRVTQAGYADDGRGGKSLDVEVRTKLLPTPRAEERMQHNSADNYVALSAVQDWREYAAAIARAEHATGRTAPPPTEPGPKGNPRLSPAFVEWLMMLPCGHVTDPAIGLTRNEQLKALGNGVVPPQAAAATRAFIADTIAERGAA